MGRAERLREDMKAEIEGRERANAAQRQLHGRRLADAETERRKLLDAHQLSNPDGGESRLFPLSSSSSGGWKIALHSSRSDSVIGKVESGAVVKRWLTRSRCSASPMAT